MLTIHTSISLPRFPTLGRLGGLAGQLSRQALQAYRHYVMRRELARLSDRLLTDIGVEGRTNRETGLFDPAARTDGLWFPPVSLH